jgi:hypothetical protein
MDAVKKKLYSVLSGDLVGSSKLGTEERKELPVVLKDSFKLIVSIFPKTMESSFDVYRGDSFQGVLSEPAHSLGSAIIIRAYLRYRLSQKADARISIGIGQIDYLPREHITEGYGEAFSISGKLLDKMKKSRYNLQIETPSEEINKELKTEFILLDFLISKWSPEQAEAIIAHLRGSTQEEIAKELKISQPAVHKRLENAGFWLIDQMCDRYEKLMAKL